MQQTDLLIQSTTSQQSTPRHDTKIQKYTSSSVVHRRLDFHRPPQKRLNEWHSSASFLAKVEPTTGGTPTVSPHFCGNVSPTLWKSVPHIVGSHSPPSLSDSSVSFSFPECPPMLPPLPGLWHTAAPLWDKKKVFVPTPPTHHLCPWDLANFWFLPPFKVQRSPTLGKTGKRRSVLKPNLCEISSPAQKGKWQGLGGEETKKFNGTLFKRRPLRIL